MQQHDLDRAIARASGESVATISRRGFVLLTPTPKERESGTDEYEDLLVRPGISDLKEPQHCESSASVP